MIDALATRRHQPMRTCVGCRQRDHKVRLLRVVVAPGRRVVADPGQRKPGRGAYLHPTSTCAERAIPRGLARALRNEIKPSDAEALRLAAEQATKRPVTAASRGQS